MNREPNAETREEREVREWLADEAPASAPASLRQTLESVTAARRPGGGSRSWPAGRAGGFLAAAAALAIVAVVAASVYMRGSAPVGQPSPTSPTSPTASASASPSNTPEATVAATSSWHLVTDQLPAAQGEGGGSAAFARPGGGFVAFVTAYDDNGVYGSDVFTSSDGLVWTRQSRIAAQIGGMAYSGTTAIAVGCTNYGDPEKNAFLSLSTADFKTWQTSVLPGKAGSDCVYRVVNGRAGFVAWTVTSTAKTLIWRSVDGRTWTQSPANGLPLGDPTENLFAVSDGYAIQGFLSDRAATWFSPDGITWTQAWAGPDPVGSLYYQLGRVLASPGGGYIAFGWVYNTGRRPIWTSPDGLQWTLTGRTWLIDKESSLFLSIASGPRGYVAAGLPMSGSMSVPAIWVSTNGADWAQEPLPAAVSTMSVHVLWVVNDGTHTVVVCVADRATFLLVQ